MSKNNLPSRFSLLWPEWAEGEDTAVSLHPTAARDLSLHRAIREMSDGPDRSQIETTLHTLITNPQVIQYRQAVLGDLWHQPPLLARLEELAPHIHALDAYRRAVDRPRTALQEVTWRLGELESLVTCVVGLSEIFAELGTKIKSEGIRTLMGLVARLQSDPTFQNMQQSLPELLQQVRTKASVTIGVNLDGRLRPIAATLLSINDEPFTTAGFLDKLLGRGRAGLGQLHEVPLLEQGMGTALEREFSPLMVPLFKDLAEVLERTSQPIAKALTQYIGLNSSFLAGLSQDVSFYLAAVHLMQKLAKAGLPLCQPEIAPQAARLCELTGGYNLNLALHQIKMDLPVSHIVLNDVFLGEAHGRVAILTGPNQGGKTTYTQMVGLCQIMAQVGMWVPAQSAVISPVDGIFTHYPVEEQLERSTGRFGDEAERLSGLFDHATRHSLILLNESLSSTSPGESLYLAQDIARIMRRMGTRAIFGTHLHQLAAEVARLNQDTTGDSDIFSLIASPVLPEGEEEAHDGEIHRSYRIEPGPPAGRSYATEIARKYGISYDQLLARLGERGVVG